MRIRLPDVMLVALAILYFVGVTWVDQHLWADRSPTLFLALPILLVSIKKPPRFVLLVSVLAIAAYAVDGMEEHPQFTLWISSFIALVAISYGGLVVALMRKQAREQRHRWEATIRRVEALRQPLTVIIAYAQRLCARPNGLGVSDPALTRIDNAARNLRTLIDDLLEEETARSA